MVIIANITNSTFTLAGIIGVLGIIIAGFLYLISGGKEQQMQQAKAALGTAVVGLIIVATAWLMINTIMTLIGYNHGTWYAPDLGCAYKSTEQQDTNELDIIDQEK